MLRLVWSAAVIASLVVGGRALYGRITTRARIPVTPRASSDSLLAVLAVDRAAESVREALAGVPAGDAVVFAGPVEDPFFIQTLYMVSFLAQPRQVGGLGCRAATGAGEVIVPMDSGEKISAVLFFRREPGASGAQRVAPGLSLLRIPPQAATSQWTSFCSSPPLPSS